MGNSVLDRLAARAPVMTTVSLPRGSTALHTMPTSTGYEIRDSPRYSWDGRKRGQSAFTVLQHTVAGSGQLRYERRTMRLRAGETMLVTIPHDHRYWVEDGGRWEFFWISMSGQEALRIHREILAAVGPVVKLRPATIEQIAACSLRLIEGASGTAGAASVAAYEALMALYDDVFSSEPTAGDGLGHIQRVIVHIRDNLQDELSVTDLSAFCGMSRAHFTRKFAAAAGLPPAEFVLQERMRKAAELLLDDASTPIKEIAVRTGIADANYFGKVFRRVYGASPGEFRTSGMYAVSPNDRAQTPKAG